MIDWKDLIERRNVWVAHNFPTVDTHPGQSIMGVMEEAGELAHAHLKELQHIRGTSEQHQEAAKDAIGDATVYLLGVMHCWQTWPGLKQDDSMEVGVKPATADDALFKIGMRVGRLCGNVESRGWRYWKVVKLVMALEQYCELRGWDYEAIVNETWNEVEQRDWIMNPDTGLPT